jgi:putative ABC transport system permease protein
MSVTLGAPRGMEAMDELARLPGVRRAEPFRVVDARIRAGTRHRRVAIEGVSSAATLRPPIDVEGRVREVRGAGLALAEGLAEVLGVELGEHVVVEVLEERRPVFTARVTALYSSFVGPGARMDASELARAMGEGPRVTGAHLLIDPARQRELDVALREAPLVVAASARSDTLRRFRETTTESMGFMAFFLVLFATVLVAGVVYNDARVTLAERGRELASMRVLGYRRGEVATIFLGETWLLAACGIPVGCVLGAGLAWVTLKGAESEMLRMPLTITTSTYAVTALVLIAAAVVSGLLCRRGLDRIDLVEVLKERS